MTEWKWASECGRYGVVLSDSDTFLYRQLSKTSHQLTLLRPKLECTYDVWIGKRAECGCGREGCRHIAIVKAKPAAK